LRPDIVNPCLIDQKLIKLFEPRCSLRKHGHSRLFNTGFSRENRTFRSGTK
jgi:hypothetical protein